MSPEPGETRVVLRLALDPQSLRAYYDKATWAQELADIADNAVPQLLRVAGYDLGEMLLTIRMVSGEPPRRLRKLLRDHDGVKRLRARLADLGARPEFEIDEEHADAS
jgi:hypothetical protein